MSEPEQTPSPLSEGLLGRLGRERFLLSFVSDHLKGIDVTLQTRATELTASLSRVEAAFEELKQGVGFGLSEAKELQSGLEDFLPQLEATTRRLSTVQEALGAAGGDTAALARGLTGLHEPSQEAASQTEELKKTAAEAARLVSALAEVGEQVNMLALNAVIEADRSGRQGRPFSLLSEEIRSVVRQSNDMGRHINEDIIEIISEVDLAAGSVAGNAEKFGSSLARASELNPSFKELTQGVGTLRANHEELQRGLRAFADLAKDVQARAEQSGAFVERASFTAEAASSSGLEQEKLLKGICDQIQELLLQTSGHDETRTAAPSLNEVRALNEAALGRAIESEGILRELAGGLDNLARFGSDQVSATSLALRKAERLDTMASQLADRSALLKRQTSEMASRWKQQIHTRVTELLNGIEAAIGELGQAVERTTHLEGKLRSIERNASVLNRLALKLDLLAFTGKLRAVSAGADAEAFSSVAQDIQDLGRDSAGLSDNLFEVATQLWKGVSAIRSHLVSAEAAARKEHTPVGRLRETLRSMQDALEGLEGEIGVLETACSRLGDASKKCCNGLASQVSSSEASAAGIRQAGRTLSLTSESLSVAHRQLEKVRIRIEAGSTAD